MAADASMRRYCRSLASIAWPVLFLTRAVTSPMMSTTSGKQPQQRPRIRIE
jgi:hypothetical protein